MLFKINVRLGCYLSVILCLELYVKGRSVPGFGAGHVQMPDSQHKGDLLAWRGKPVGRESEKVRAESTTKQAKSVSSGVGV